MKTRKIKTSYVMLRLYQLQHGRALQGRSRPNLKNSLMIEKKIMVKIEGRAGKVMSKIRLLDMKARARRDWLLYN